MDNEIINNEVNTDLQEQGTGLNEAENTETINVEEKAFTQQQLNDIVEKRLAKERKRLMRMIEDDAAVKAELEKNRLQLSMTKKLTAEGYPIDLAELFDYSDEKSCNASYGKVIEVFNKALNKKVDLIFRSHGRTPHGATSANGSSGPPDLRSAFGLNRGE